MMEYTILQVKEWHEAFKVPIKHKPDVTNTDINELRITLLQEELDELKEALYDKGPIEVLDALSDLQYVLDGTYLSLGFWHLKYEAFDEVHRSNMTKLNEDGNPVYNGQGKVMKGDNFEEPQLEKIL